MVGRGLGEQDQELLAPEAVAPIDVTDPGQQRLRDLPEDLVARQVPVGVVVGLEGVDIAQGKGVAAA